MKRLLGLIALVAVPSLAAPRKAAVPPPPPPPPPYILSIQEIPEGGGAVIPCPTVSPDCSADILSTLEIAPNMANVPQHAPPSTPSPATAEEAADAQRRVTLNGALTALNESIALSRQIIERHAAGAAAATLDPMSEQFARLRIDLNDAIVKTLALDPANAGKTPADIQRTDAYRDAFRSPSATGQWLAEQIAALDRRSAERLAATPGAALQLRLAASRIRAGGMPTPLHLPGYDTFDELSAAPIQRITFNVDSAERARNAADVQATAAIVDLIRTNFKALGDAYRKELDDAKARVDAAKKDLEAITAKNHDLGPALALVTKNLNDAAGRAGEPLKSRLTKTAADLTTLTTTVQTTINAVTTAQQTLAAVPSKLDSSALNVAAGRPDLVLDNVLGIAEGAKESVTSAAGALQTASNALGAQLAAVDDDLRTLAANAPAEAGAVVARLRVDLVNAIAGPIEQLQATQLIMAALNDPNAKGAAKTAGPVANVSSPRVLSVSNPLPTQLQIRRTDPADNDTIDIAAQVLDVANKVVYEEHRSVRVRFYGWHSGLASGLVLVRAQETAQEDFKPEAAAIWRVVRTPRPWEDNWRTWYYKIRPAVGFHSTTLHFGNDNNAVQFGLGVSAHLFDDLLQAGYGWNIGVAKKRGYGYVGFGLIKVLRGQLSGN